jgi:hypothetical protein
MCLGFGWLRFANGVCVYAPAVCLVRGHYRDPAQATLSVLRLIGLDEEILIPGAPDQVCDAIIDALGVGEPHPLNISAQKSISHMGKP